MDRLRQPGPCVVKSNDGFPLGWTQVRTANMFMSAVGRPIARRRACSRLFGNLSMFPRPKRPLPTGRSSVGLQTPDEPLEGRSLADERLFGEIEEEGGGRSRNLTLLQVASLRQRYASVCMRIMIILSYGVVMFVCDSNGASSQALVLEQKLLCLLGVYLQFPQIYRGAWLLRAVAAGRRVASGLYVVLVPGRAAPPSRICPCMAGYSTVAD